MKVMQLGLMLTALAFSTSSFETQASGLSPGQVLNKTHRANTHNIVRNFVETRKGYGYVTFTGGKVIGNTSNDFTVTVGPHNTTLGSVLGGVDLNFKPEDAECVRGLHLSLSVGSDVPFSLSPTCDALLRTDIKRTISHTVASFDVPIPAVPIDPAGIFRLGVSVGAALKVGADFEAGLEVGGFDKPNKPIKINGVRRPDFIFASVRPFISGDATAKGYARLNLLFKTVEKGVKGSLTLINAGTKAYAEAGVTYKKQPGKKHQYYTRLKWDANAQGGNGKVGLYCDVKLFGFARIFYAETDLISWSPIYEFNQTIYDQTAYL
ncbi:hypothetical protein A1OO_13325 [Enterovibrio norvegicus FF-33]|uniref:Uncharacterized protein n=1 Tax=Enterovibrio norvegicus FF-454 TaxID=1185651 RepID=A0A1E5CBE2_9GAMM|nr:hypothetical protein [Enterovibrio norvegicus]OEE62826.1 hypothetical protein A1OK_19790 [Enterovibrio norvegicus FF-454]OEE66742.1 hypothetical protein A1OO_13325 [Enterovibrio norvegicus FF-33]OEE82720.1 hypothetical protein A1OQ_19550 [Enterovibrio norvegicus FF-162]